MLVETTPFYDSMARSFYEVKVAKNGDVTLPTSEDDSE